MGSSFNAVRNCMYGKMGILWYMEIHGFVVSAQTPTLGAFGESASWLGRDWRGFKNQKKRKLLYVFYLYNFLLLNIIDFFSNYSQIRSKNKKNSWTPKRFPNITASDSKSLWCFYVTTQRPIQSLSRNVRGSVVYCPLRQWPEPTELEKSGHGSCS